MIEELRAFVGKAHPPLELEGYRVEHQLEPFWMGRPARGPYALQMVAALACGLIGVVLYASGSAPSLAVLTAGILVACLYPFVAARDWQQTEYILAPDLVVHKAGAFSKTLRIHDLSRYAAVEEETPRFARRLGYRNLHLRGEEDESDSQSLGDVKLPYVPVEVAAGFLDVLDMLAEPSTPEAESVMSAPSRPSESESPPGDQP